FFERHAAALHSRSRLVGSRNCARIVSDRRHENGTVVGNARRYEAIARQKFVLKTGEQTQVSHEHASAHGDRLSASLELW
ncbi:MAG TPA: hypothetical protein VFL30_10680, partial [Rhodanobacteraceae bacterium]|nr:hypothetical protein [Rhodanobacteraceae bacterium]